MIADLLVTSGSSFAPAPTSTVGRLLPSYFPIHLGCVSKVESMTAERKNLQNQKEIRAECRIFL